MAVGRIKYVGEDGLTVIAVDEDLIGVRPLVLVFDGDRGVVDFDMHNEAIDSWMGSVGHTVSAGGQKR